MTNRIPTWSSRPSAEEVQALWLEFGHTRSTEVRAKLAEVYYYLVRIIAKQVGAHLPRSVIIDDLRSMGAIGLMKAIERFDPGRNVNFEAYAKTRIYGAILDGLRAQDFIPRTVREQADTYNNARSKLVDRLNREPSIHEIAEELGVTAEKAEALRRRSNLRTVYNLSSTDLDGDSRSRPIGIDVLVDPHSRAPMEDLETRNLVARLCRRLTERERMIVTLYYLQGLSMEEVGRAMKLTESRIYQIHAALLRKLRE